jgi:hypothetical protein
MYTSFFVVGCCKSGSWFLGKTNNEELTTNNRFPLSSPMLQSSEPGNSIQKDEPKKKHTRNKIPLPQCCEAASQKIPLRKMNQRKPTQRNKISPRNAAEQRARKYRSEK